MTLLCSLPTQLNLHWLNQPPSFALGGKGSPRSQSVIPAHRVHPSSRLPLDVQHLLEFLPPSWLLGLLLLWFLHIECILPPGCHWMCSTSWNSSLLAPRSPTPALVPGHNLFSRGSPVGPISCPGPGSFGPSCSYLIPVSCLSWFSWFSWLQLQWEWLQLPWEPLMVPCSSSYLLDLCVHAHHGLPPFPSSFVTSFCECLFLVVCVYTPP